MKPILLLQSLLSKTESFLLQFERFLTTNHKEGKLPIPFYLKVALIRELAAYYNTPVLVETGTYYGRTISSLANKFQKIYSCELSPLYYEKSSRSLSRKKNIQLFNLSTDIFLEQIATTISERCIIYLDAHFSGGHTAGMNDPCPHLKELEIISKSHIFDHCIVLLDDSRCWSTETRNEYGWPSCNQLDKRINCFKYKFFVADTLALTNINPLEL